MNRSAYLTTGLAIKALSSLSKADVVVHGKDNIPDGPSIFVMNHFTRVETFLLPYYIYNLTNKPVWSLAAAVLFKGGLEKFFNLVGVVSTDDPKRDELIVKSLLSSEANWIIFPEGSMVKTKKIIDGGKYMIAHPKGMHEPHTGAAALALRAELFRRHLLTSFENGNNAVDEMLASLGLESIDDINSLPTNIVPVNLTYYPIRAAENIASTIAAKLVKDIPDRMVEEIMTEGTMLLSGVDLDIRFGKPISMADYLRSSWLQEDLRRDSITGYSVSGSLKAKMKKVAYNVMQRYMGDIYSLTTVNHEHLFASFLRLYPFKRVREVNFKRRVFYGASLVCSDNGSNNIFLHKSLKEDQTHLLTDDRFGKYENFITLAEEKGVVERYEDYLIRDRAKLSVPLGVHKGRIDNPIEVMANEVEPLVNLQKLIRTVGWQPELLLKFSLIKYLIRKGAEQYQEDCKKYAHSGQEGQLCEGKPFLLSSYRFRTGVVLVHSYLSLPEEVRALARYLRRKGCWVYAPRLPGHGTSAVDLSGRRAKEWIEAIETGYVLLSLLCKKVVVGGVAVGGNLSLDLASRVPEVAGAFAISPPYGLKDYSSRFMPAQDVWNRLLSKLKRGEQEENFLDFDSGNPHVNYPQNPVTGIKEVGDYLDSIQTAYNKIQQPVLIVQADKNPVVAPEASLQLYNEIGSGKKEFCMLRFDRHVLVNGAGADMAFQKVSQFIESL